MSINPENERIRRQYLTFLKEANRLSDRTLDGIARALATFENHVSGRDFRKFHIRDAISFKAALAAKTSARTNAKLSESSRHATLLAVKNFFKWLAGQRGYKSRVSYTDAEYFSLSAKETRIATARREKDVPTIEQIRHVIRSMPARSDIERRNRALIAFTLLTGARVDALASLRLKHVNLSEGKLVQDAREVRTKRSKTFTTYFFPVGNDIRDLVADWVTYLRTEKLMGHDDPLFPRSCVKVGKNQQYEADGLGRAGWSDTDPIRKIFKDAFSRADLPYFNPHSFRGTLVVLGEQLCQTPEEFKSWSQNLGHDDVLITFTSYGEVPARRQAEIIRTLTPTTAFSRSGVARDGRSPSNVLQLGDEGIT